jgi:hypothetical protein
VGVAKEGSARGHASLLFGLAAGGVCRAVDVAIDAVRSYRTISPLPRSREASFAGVRRFLSVALSVDLRRLAVSEHRALDLRATNRL